VIWTIFLLPSLASTYTTILKILDGEALTLLIVTIIGGVIGATLPTKTVQTCLAN
jgi:hypothetical protein